MTIYNLYLLIATTINSQIRKVGGTNMSCVQIPEENQAAALLHYLGISRTRKGYWYIRWILEWGRQEEMDEARF